MDINQNPKKELENKKEIQHPHKIKEVKTPNADEKNHLQINDTTKTTQKNEIKPNTIPKKELVKKKSFGTTPNNDDIPKKESEDLNHSILDEKFNEQNAHKTNSFFNFQSPKPNIIAQPMIFAKYDNKRFENENEFRKLVSLYEDYSNEISFLYQNDKKKEMVKEHILQLQNSFNDTLKKLLPTLMQQDKIKVINEFYTKNDLHQFQELMIKNLYNPIHKIPKEFQNIDTKSYFQDFDPSLNKTDINFGNVKYIQPPKNYDHKLEPEMIDKYDKFVAIVNLIITIQKLIDFKTKFDQQNKLFASEEKKLFEDERRKDEEKRLEYEREELREEKARIQKEEEILREDEKRRDEMQLKDVDQQIKEKKKILAHLKDSITSLTTQIAVFEKRKTDLEQHFFAVEKERVKVENELSQNYNDLLKALKDTHKKEKKIESLLHHSPQATKTSSEQSIESFAFIEMSKTDKEAYFNKLVNSKTDDKFDIRIRDFCTLTESITIVTEQQFEYMIDYYNHWHSKGDGDCKFVFKNLKVIPIAMVQRIYDLKDFSVEYLSKEVLDKLVHRSLLVDKLINNVEKILFIKEKTEKEQEKLIKECKKEYYSICNSTSNEVYIYEDTKIIESLFFNGYSIEKVVLPDSVIEIQDNAFYECKNLKTVVMNCKKLKAIGKSAFSGCINLESFTFPDKIKVIHKCTFLGCQNLSKIVLPPGLEEIKGKAFSGCKSLTTIKLPKTIQKIGKGVFEKCTSLKVFVIPGVLAVFPNGEEVPKGFNDQITIQNFKISAKCFNKCKEFQNVIITNKCNLIDESSFNGCAKLEKVTYFIPNTSKIGVYAFSDCPQLKHAIFNANKGSSLEISDFSFMNCKELSDVEFNHQELFAPNALVIDSNVFHGCEKLKKFICPPNCSKEIGESCFEGCKNLEVVSLPNGITTIGKNMFKDCGQLATINLDETITAIDVSAFENCAKLQIEKLPLNLVKIGNNAFAKCTSLDIKEFPSKLEEIGEGAFEGCVKLVDITFPESMKIIQKKAFENCTELVKITIYSKSINILKKAFFQCSSLKKIFTDNKSGISSEAFGDCAKGLDFFSLEN